MNEGLMYSLLTYGITIVISIIVAGLIWVMVQIMSLFSKGEVDEMEAEIEEARAAAEGDDAEVAAVIAIAKSR